MRPALLVLTLCASTAAQAGFVSDWQASSGLFPDQISPPYSLTDNANPESPVFVNGALRLSTSADAELMFYRQLEPVVDTSGPFTIEARLRFISGQSSSDARAPMTIALTTAPNVGNTFFIGQDRVFFNASAEVRGATAAVDTDGAFHTYRIDYDGAGGLSVTQDGIAIITGASTFTSASFNGAQERITFGEGSILAFGSADWEFFRHNALAVPEPQTYALLLAGLGLLGFAARRKT